jgi:hypothetical protein
LGEVTHDDTSSAASPLSTETSRDRRSRGRAVAAAEADGEGDDDDDDNDDGNDDYEDEEEDENEGEQDVGEDDGPHESTTHRAPQNSGQAGHGDDGCVPASLSSALTPPDSRGHSAQSTSEELGDGAAGATDSCVAEQGAASAEASSGPALPPTRSHKRSMSDVSCHQQRRFTPQRHDTHDIVCCWLYLARVRVVWCTRRCVASCAAPCLHSAAPQRRAASCALPCVASCARPCVSFELPVSAGSCLHQTV